jgi:hypothetical protein
VFFMLIIIPRWLPLQDIVFTLGPIGSFYYQVNDTGSWEPLVVFYNLIINTLPLFHCPFNILCGTSFSHPEEWKRWSTSSVRNNGSNIVLLKKCLWTPHQGDFR